MNRFATVEEKIREDCAHGRVKAAIQNSDGTFREIAKTLWNTQRHREWFEKLKLSSIDAYGGYTTNKTPEHWLFFERESFETCFATPHVSNVLHANLDRYVSPFMKLMLAVSDKLQIAETNQPKKEVIVDELIKMSKLKGFPIISPSLAKSAATLMREFEAQAGSASSFNRKLRS